MPPGPQLLPTWFLFSSSNWISINENNLENENIRVNSSDIFKTNLTFEIDNFNFIDVEGENGKIVRIKEGAQLLQYGAPDLPQLATSIIIPDDQAMEVNIISSNYIDFVGIKTTCFPNFYKIFSSYSYFILIPF